MSETLHTFTKEERLCSKTDIDTLIKKGRYRKFASLRICFLPTEKECSRIMISVPKRLFKRAVKRNRLKRLIRESYRLQKHLLPEGAHFDIQFVYTEKELRDFKEIYAQVSEALKSVTKQEKS